TTKVKNDAASIQSYIENIGATKFAGGMERQAATIGGAFEQLKDNIANTVVELSNSSGLNSAIAGILNGINVLVDEAKMMWQSMSESEAVPRFIGLLSSAGKAINDFMTSTLKMCSTTGTAWEMLGVAVTVASEV